MRLIRTLIVLTGAGVLLPSPPDDPFAGTADPDIAQVSAIEMLSSATSTFSDLAGFCGRQPAACETAAYVAAHLEAKAKYSAKLVYEWATDEQGPSGRAVVPVDVETSDRLQTGSTSPLAAATEGTNSQSTLRMDDLLPVWHAPRPVPKNG